MCVIRPLRELVTFRDGPSRERHRSLNVAPDPASVLIVKPQKRQHNVCWESKEETVKKLKKFGILALLVLASAGPSWACYAASTPCPNGSYGWVECNNQPCAVTLCHCDSGANCATAFWLDQCVSPAEDNYLQECGNCHGGTQ